jgi:nucleoside-diphosphate-sugar epimerase
MIGAVLVTGGTGFVGANLVEALVARGLRVIAFGHNPPLRPFSSKVRVTLGDIRRDDDLEAAIAGERLDAIVHAAAITSGPARERESPEAIVAVNVGGTIVAMRAAARHRVSRVLALSSVAVYGFAEPGPNGLLAYATTRTAPVALYGITKLAAEQTALRLGELYGIDARAVRLGPVFGPHEHPTGLRDAMTPHRQATLRAREGRSVLLPRSCSGDWLYARDAGEGLAAVLMADGIAGRVLDFGGGAATTLPQWCDALRRRIPELDARIAGAGEDPNVFYALPRDRVSLDNADLTAATGFAPKFDLDRAADDYLDWLDGGPG